MRQTKHPSVLILEDEAIVALDLEVTLADAGFNVAHVATTCSGALEWLERLLPDLGVLDITLSDGDCVEVAQILVERSIPFLVFSVRAMHEACDPIFLKGTWVEKPCATTHVVAALGSRSTTTSNPGSMR